MGFATFKEFEGSLLEESSKVEQRFAEWGKDLFKAKDSLRALVKERISDGNRDEAYRLAKEVDLVDAELKELKIRQNLIREKWKWLTLEKKHSIALTHKEKATECDDKKEEAMIVEDVADVTTMKDELEIDQVGPGSCGHYQPRCMLPRKIN